MYITEKMNVKVVNVVSQESEDNTLERDGGSTSTSLYSGDCRTTPTYVSSFCLFLKCIIFNSIMCVCWVERVQCHCWSCDKLCPHS